MGGRSEDVIQKRPRPISRTGEDPSSWLHHLWGVPIPSGLLVEVPLLQCPPAHSQDEQHSHQGEGARAPGSPVLRCAMAADLLAPQPLWQLALTRLSRAAPALTDHTAKEEVSEARPGL